MHRDPEFNPLEAAAAAALQGNRNGVIFWRGCVYGVEHATRQPVRNGYIEAEVVFDGRLESKLFGIRSAWSTTLDDDDPRDGEVFFWLNQSDLDAIAGGGFREEWRFATDADRERYAPRTSEVL